MTSAQVPETEKNKTSKFQSIFYRTYLMKKTHYMRDLHILLKCMLSNVSTT